MIQLFLFSYFMNAVHTLETRTFKNRFNLVSSERGDFFFSNSTFKEKKPFYERVCFTPSVRRGRSAANPSYELSLKPLVSGRFGHETTLTLIFSDVSDQATLTGKIQL